MQLSWQIKSYADLSTDELYAILQLRQLVFIVEQNCPYLDADNKDKYCHHLMGWDQNGQLIAYCRLIPTGISYPTEASIGRVVNHPDSRGQSIGKLLMQKAIDSMDVLFPNQPIRIGAQSYLLHFYESLGFENTGIEYLEDGIPHNEMTKR